VRFSCCTGGSDEQHTADLVTTFRQHVAAADGVEALNAALARGLGGLWASIEKGELIVEFELVAPDGRSADHREGVHRLQHAKPVGLEARRVTFPVAKPGTTPSSRAATGPRLWPDSPR
jgi:hypothetical protein